MSKIVKSNFVAFTEQKKEIRIIANNDPKVIKNSIKAVEIEQDVDEDAVAEYALNQDHTQVLDELKEKIEQEAYDQGIELGRQEGYDDGHQKGYQKGYDEGKAISSQECKRALDEERQRLFQQIEQERLELEQDFEEKKKALEPKMLHIIEELVTKLIGIQSVSSGTIMYLIHSGMNALDLHGDLVIKVSSIDIDEVLEHKHQLTEGLSEKIDVEVLIDQQLEKNECIIETNMGSIDCSLGTQMESLMQELRLIHDSLKGEDVHGGYRL